MSNFWISGALWLDAVNSEWMGGGQRVDGWPDVATLQAWLLQSSEVFAEAGSLSQAKVETEADLEAAKALRAALRAACVASHEGRAMPQAVVDELNAILSRRGVTSRLEATAEGWREREALEPGAEFEGALWILARSAARSWTAGDLKRLKPCANPNCILWFLDTSKNGTRRWCSMQACGNRSKVTAHYARRSEAKSSDKNSD
ncbi:MAG TPA: CGNR zinc finger domain-containing protein [Abditibacterium sp.]|jgi:predicted RNA-binding Zn ribbon-like protein